jgi:hypothetical protein
LRELREFFFFPLLFGAFDLDAELREFCFSVSVAKSPQYDKLEALFVPLWHLMLESGKDPPRVTILNVGREAGNFKGLTFLGPFQHGFEDPPRGRVFHRLR